MSDATPHVPTRAVRIALVVALALGIAACSGGSDDAGSTTTTEATTTTAPTATTTTAAIDPDEAAAFAEQFAGAGFDAKESACLGTAAATLTAPGEDPSLSTEDQAFHTCDVSDARLEQLGLLTAVQAHRASQRDAVVEYLLKAGATSEQATCIADQADASLGGAPLSNANRDLLLPAVDGCGADATLLGF